MIWKANIYELGCYKTTKTLILLIVLIERNIQSANHARNLMGPPRLYSHTKKDDKHAMVISAAKSITFYKM